MPGRAALSKLSPVWPCFEFPCQKGQRPTSWSFEIVASSLSRYLKMTVKVCVWSRRSRVFLIGECALEIDSSSSSRCSTVSLSSGCCWTPLSLWWRCSLIVIVCSSFRKGRALHRSEAWRRGLSRWRWKQPLGSDHCVDICCLCSFICFEYWSSTPIAPWRTWMDSPRGKTAAMAAGNSLGYRNHP